MRLLLDTRILLGPLPKAGRLSVSRPARLIGEPDNELTFSAVSLWEVAIKTGRGRDDFRIDVRTRFVGSCSTTATPNSRYPAPMRPGS